MQEGEQRLLAHAEGGPEGVRGQRRHGVPQEGEHALAQRILGRRLVADKAGALGVDAQAEAQGRRTGGGAVLDAELEEPVAGEAAEIEIGVAAIPISA